jgi:dienelactone hydrolase
MTLAAAVVAAAGCPNIQTDPGEGSGELAVGPTVEFDPANSIIPFPNNLLLGSDGKVNVPKQCNESAAQTALRTGVLNTLDGFGTFEVGLQATFTTTPDMTTLTSSTVQLYKRADAGSAVDPSTAKPVPATIELGTSARFSADCSTSTQIDTLTVIPQGPLDEHSTYTVVLLDGIKDKTGSDFLPSFTWSLVRQAVDPVTIGSDGSVVSESTPLDPNDGPAVIAQLLGIDELWRAHAPALTFLGKVGITDRSTILLAWDFNTQTTTDPLDAHIPTSPAGAVPKTPFSAVASLTSLICGHSCSALEALSTTAVGPLCTTDATGSAQPGGYIPCNAVGDILGVDMPEDIYQTDTPNAFNAAAPIPGPWNDPLAPTVVHPAATIGGFAMVPTGTPPAAGWPVVIYGHGLGSKKETLVAIGPQLAARGFASVGIDWVAHGARAVQITSDPTLGCSGTPDASVSPQCFAPFLSADLATTRDNIRQSIVDAHRLHAALVACGTTACGELQVDPTRIEYIGISLGGIMGSTFTSTADLPGAALNVPGVGWLDILENTANLDIACTLVDALIDAGILTGDKSNLSANPPTGLCTTSAWKTQPGYQTFASAARWVLDSADGANFTPKLAQQRFLIQEVVNDQVVPNIACDDEGGLVGLSPAVADKEQTGGEPPSAALATITENHWLRYPTLPPDATATPPFPGNAYQHASLLEPDTSISLAAGILGTIRVETDALAFLIGNETH